jgi:hypothetical protein
MKAALALLLVAGSAQAQTRGGLRSWAERNFTVRAEVRAARVESRDLVRSGNLHGASQRLADLGTKPQGLRERMMLAGARHDVQNATLSQMRSRSSAGDVVGTEDARQSLATLRGSKQLSWFAGWRAARAENRAFKNVLAAANHAGKQGNFDLARDNLNYASELRGPSNVGVAKGIEKLYKTSMKTAARQAWQGDFQGTSVALQTAASAAEAGGGRFDDARAQKLMKRAFHYAVPNLIAQADVSWRRGDPDAAAMALRQSMEIQKGENIRPNFILARRQRSLAAHLGPRMAALEAPPAAEQAQQ